MADVIVVGGGLIGMLTARELSRGGLSVILVEKGDTGREASWAGGGILSPLYPWRFPEAVTRLAHWSQQAYPDLCDELAAQTGVDPQFLPSGLLILDPADRPEADAWLRRWDVEHDWLSAEAVAQREPALGISPGEGLWLPGVAQVRTPRLAKALRYSLDADGVEVREHCSVTGVAVDGEQVAGVQTADGVVPGERVVVAAGAWSGGLLRPLGLTVPVIPIRGQMLLFQGPRDTVNRIVLYRDHYLIPRRDGRILAGSTVEDVGFDKGVTEGARVDLQKVAESVVPVLRDCPVESQWAGLRPGTPDGIPLIGPHPKIGGLYVNTGHFRNGVVMAPASARLLGDLMLDREPVADPTPYRPFPGQA